MKYLDGINWGRIGKIIFFAILLMFVFALGTLNNSLDVDLWARLINGQYVFYNFLPLKNDFYSFVPTHSWYDPEWISSALLYVLQIKFGIFGLAFFKCFSFFILFCSLVFVLLKLGTKNSPYNIYYFVYIILICLQVGYLTHCARCQIFTFIFLAFWIFMLEKARQGCDKYLYFAPLVMLFWLNMHGGCLAGVGIYFIYILGEFLNKKPVKKYLLVLIPLGLIFAINPWGIEYYKFIFDSAFLDRTGISEWASSFSQIAIYLNLFLYYLIFLIISYCYSFFSQKKNFNEIDKTKLILFIVILYLSITHLKHIALAIITFTILFYDDMVDFTKLISYKINKKIKQIFLVSLYFLIFSFSTLALLGYSCAETWREKFISYPFYALEFLKQNDFKGNVLAPFEFGSYIGYKYGDRYKIFIDGRQEQVYSHSLLHQLMCFITQGKCDFENPVEQYKPNFVLLDNKALANEHMLSNKNYFLAYKDTFFSVYVLNKYKGKKLVKPIVNKKEYYNKIFDTYIDFTKDTN